MMMVTAKPSPPLAPAALANKANLVIKVRPQMSPSFEPLLNNLVCANCDHTKIHTVQTERPVTNRGIRNLIFGNTFMVFFCTSKAIFYYFLKKKKGGNLDQFDAINPLLLRTGCI